MARLFGSFLVRLWRTSRSQRIEIEHIQSGEKTLVTSVADAVDWISTHADDTPRATAAQTNQMHDSVTQRKEGSSLVRDTTE